MYGIHAVYLATFIIPMSVAYAASVTFRPLAGVLIGVPLGIIAGVLAAQYNRRCRWRELTGAD